VSRGCARPGGASRGPVRSRVPGIAIVALLSLSCSPREGVPFRAYRDFAEAVSEREADRAFALLSSDTQAWLRERARLAAGTAPGVVSPSAQQLLIGTAALASRPLASVVLLRESGSRAVVEAWEEGGPKREVELVREKGWRVRIPRPSSPAR